MKKLLLILIVGSLFMGCASAPNVFISEELKLRGKNIAFVEVAEYNNAASDAIKNYFNSL